MLNERMLTTGCAEADYKRSPKACSLKATFILILLKVWWFFFLFCCCDLPCNDGCYCCERWVIRYQVYLEDPYEDLKLGEGGTREGDWGAGKGDEIIWNFPQPFPPRQSVPTDNFFFFCSCWNWPFFFYWFTYLFMHETLSQSSLSRHKTELGRGRSSKHGIWGNSWASSKHDSGASVGSPKHGRSTLQSADLFEVAVAVNPAVIDGHVRGGATYKPEGKE